MKIRDEKVYEVELASRKSDSPTPSDMSTTGFEKVDSSHHLQKSDQPEVKNFEDLLKICGEAGWWQFKVFLLASFCGFLTAMQSLTYAFIGAVPNHWCKLPQVEDLTTAEIKNLTIPKYWANETGNQLISGDKFGEYEKCLRYEVLPEPGGNLWTNDTLPLSLSRDQSQTASCNRMEFDNSIFNSTIVTEFNLVCGEQHWGSWIQAIFMIGVLFGSPVFGSLSDRIGRRRTIWIASLIFLISGPAVSFAQTFPILMLARFIQGASSPGLYATSFVLAVESVTPKWRGLVGNLFCLPFALGYMTLPGVAYFFRNWRTLQLVLSAPSLLQILACWMSPESPRWLLRKGRVVEAEEGLRAAAKANGRFKLIPKEFHDLVQEVAGIEMEVPASETSCMIKFQTTLTGHARLFQTPQLRRRTLVLYFCWVAIAMVYYGVALNSPNLSADRYLYTFLSGVLEIPSYAMVPPLIRFLGRRKVFSGFLLLCGLSLLSSLLFTQRSTIIVVLALLGKLLIGAAYALIYLYATEVMPTLLRTFGVGSASMVGRLGSASAPFIVDLMGRDDKAKPTLVFGTFSILAGVLCLLLPETRNKRLPETVADVEEDNW